MKRTAILLLMVAALAATAGCNTVSGAGRDIERGGSAVERAGGK